MSYRMEVGKLYHVLFQRQSGNGQWSVAEMTATYLGINRYGDEDLSLRPHLGTTSIKARDIWSAELVPGPATARTDPENQKRPTRRIRALAREDVR